MSTLPHLQPGSVFARDFRVIRPLAEGGMGAVYIAEQLSTGHQRALKVMHPQLLSDSKQRERFAQEARVGSQIKSPHVVEVAAAGIDEETQTPWIAMELLEGDDLAATMRRRGALPASEVGEIFEQLGDALGKAHAAGIVHRDLKPENIFIAVSRMRNVPFVAKVLDFGISRIIAEHKTAATVTSTIGSPLWMAPEQANRGAKIRASTDVWPLGLIAYHLLTGRYYWHGANVPDEGFNLSGLLVEIMVTELEAPSTRAADRAALLPPGFDAWFGRCVHRDAEARFRDASEAVAALLPLLTQSPAGVGLMRTLPIQTPTASAAANTRPALGPAAAPWSATEHSLPQQIAPAVAPPAGRPPSLSPVVGVAVGFVALLGLGAGVLLLSNKSDAPARVSEPRPAPPETPPSVPVPVVPSAPAPAPPPPPTTQENSPQFTAAAEGVWLQHRGTIQNCYERALRRFPALASGRLITSVTLDAAGRPAEVSTAGFSGSAELRQCVEVQTRRMIFPAPARPGVTLAFRTQFVNNARTDENTPGGGPGPQREPTEPESPSRTDVMRAMGRLSAPMSACGRDHGFSGTLVVTVTFVSNGSVQSATARGSNLEMNACGERVARGAHLAPFTRPTFMVSYPYRVNPSPSGSREAPY